MILSREAIVNAVRSLGLDPTGVEYLEVSPHCIRVRYIVRDRNGSLITEDVGHGESDFVSEEQTFYVGDKVWPAVIDIS